MTLLERRRPQDFGRRDRLQVQQDTTVTIRIELGQDALLALAQAGVPLLPPGDVVEGEVRELPLGGAGSTAPQPAAP